MRSPSSRYLTGYIFRTIFGTILVLCAISAVRTCWIGPDVCGAIAAPWDKAMILPDQLIRIAIAKIAEIHAPQPSPSPATNPPPQQTTSTSNFPPPTSRTPTSQAPRVTAMPEMPAKPELPAMPSMPEMPDMPDMPTTSEIPSAESDLHTRHAKLLAAIKAREKQLRADASRSNPHKAEYVRAAKIYKQFALKNNALLKEYEDATGERRMELADELRKLKLDRDGVTETYRSAKHDYTAWKEQHPETQPKLEDDPEIRRLRQEVAKVAQQLAAP